MNKIKYLLSFFLVVLATVTIILIPDMVQAEKYKVYTGQQQVWQYDFNKKISTLTSSKAYEIYKDDFHKSVSDSTEIVNDTELQQMKENAIRVFETVFGGDKKLWRSFKKSLVESKIEYCNRTTILRAEDFEALSLNIVTAQFANGTRIVYEEKTSAVFDIFCSIENSENESTDYHKLYKCVDEYYADALEGLSVKPYFSSEHNDYTNGFAAGVVVADSEIDEIIEYKYQYQ